MKTVGKMIVMTLLGVLLGCLFAKIWKEEGAAFAASRSRQYSLNDIKQKMIPFNPYEKAQQRNKAP
ncbi:hypothetical protein [Butyrivibrio sp. LC3010]|uniref:hypothetical protein n=1 Tax=Butyrivibrio sp. LC3010 TaxID=1280680 RepID=UPI00047E200F|nr:hypothetical protein [Butyrivibrio sp. LC3010]